MLFSSSNLTFLLRTSVFLPQRYFLRFRHETHGRNAGNYTAPYSLENFEKPPIWADRKYKRRFIGHIAPKRTSKSCHIYQKNIATRKKKQCPVCDNNEFFTYKDLEFIKNFICPVTNELIHEGITGVCRRKQRRLRVEIFTARLYGLLPDNITHPALEYLKSRNVPK